MLTAGMLIAWAAAIYRVWLSWSQPRTMWRTSFTVVMVTLAVAFTLHRLKDVIDQALLTPNVAVLMSRLVVVVGLGFLLVYLHALRAIVVPRPALVVYATITTGVTATLIISWIRAPIHQRALDDLLVIPSAATAIYCLTYWTHLGVALTLSTWTFLSRWRTVRHQDLGREVGLLVSAAGSVLGIVAVIMWSISLVLTVPGPGSQLNALADQLMPIAAALIGGGVFCLLLVPYLVSWSVTWHRLHALLPLWSALVERHPQVRLDARPTGGPLTRLQFRLERMIIETLDALRITPVADPLPGDAGLDTVARSIIDGADPGTGHHATELLDHSESREGEVDQLIGLANVYRRRHHASA